MSKKSAFLLAGAFLLIYVAPLGIRPLFVPDEVRYAEIPREMRATGDWIVPHLNGLLYFEKPVLGYWLNAISQDLFGENRFAVRLPSALAAGLSLLAILLLLGGRDAKNREIAVLAGALFLLCPLVFLCGTYNILDGPFTAFFTLAMALFFRGHTAESSSRKRWFFAAFGIASGLAFLTKGLLGWVLPALVIVPFLLFRRQVRELFRFPWIPLLLAIFLALPWGLAIHFREPDFWRYFIWHEHLQRFFDPTSAAQHPEPPWFFIPVLLGGAGPLLFLAPAAWAGLRRSWKEPLISFCLLWLVLVFVFFSTSEGKLGTYILPCFPPLAVLVALGVQRYLQSGQVRLFHGGSVVLGGLLLILLGGVAALQWLPFPADWRLYSRPETGRWLLGSGGILAWAIVLFRGTKANVPLRKLAFFAAAPAIFMVGFSASLPNLAFTGKTAGALLERNADRVTPDSWLGTSPHLVGALAWGYHRSDVLLIRTEGEFAYGLKRTTQTDRFVPLQDISSFAAAHAGTGRLTLLLKKSAFEEYTPLLPRPLYLDRACGFVFAQY